MHFAERYRVSNRPPELRFIFFNESRNVTDEIAAQAVLLARGARADLLRSVRCRGETDGTIRSCVHVGTSNMEPFREKKVVRIHRVLKDMCTLDPVCNSPHVLFQIDLVIKEFVREKWGP